MYREVNNIFSNGDIAINLYNYPYESYVGEVRCHEKAIYEYSEEISATMESALNNVRIDIQQSNTLKVLNPVLRSLLVDYLLKVLMRLKLLPFVFVKAVRYFDRYCLKQIIYLNDEKLIITVCLWIAAKFTGGNTHFINLNPSHKKKVRSVSDLGYGPGGRFYGPTQRYRIPKIRELIKIGGLFPSYNAKMIRDMELRILNVLEWKLNEPSLEEYMVYSHEFKITHDIETDRSFIELFKIKQFIAYSAAYCYGLVGYSLFELAKVIVDLVNHTFCFSKDALFYQTLNNLFFVDGNDVEVQNYHEIYRQLLYTIVRPSPYLLLCFGSRGPRLLHSTIISKAAESSFLGRPSLPRTPISSPPESFVKDDSQYLTITSNYKEDDCREEESIDITKKHFVNGGRDENDGGYKKAYDFQQLPIRL